MKKIEVQKLATFSGHRDSVYAMEKGAVSHQLFSAAGDGMVVKWDLQTPDQGELIARIPASVYALHYAPMQNQLWIGQNFEGLHIIDLESKEEIKALKLTTSTIFDIQSWENKVFIAVGDGTVILVDLTTFAVLNYTKVSEKSARCLAINPIRGELAVGYSDHSIRIFDLTSLHLKYSLQSHTNSVFTVTYSPDYQFLLSAGRDAHLKVWHADSGYALHTSVVAHMYAINSLTFSPSGKYFLTGSLDKTIKVWDAAEYRLLKVIDRVRHQGHASSVNKLLWSDFQGQFVSCSDDRTLAAWKLWQGEVFELS
jgi:WD40 repeat protein